MTLLDRLADPNLLDKMTTGEKINASIQTTILGMGITFAALIIIWGLCILLKNVVKSIENKPVEKAQVVKKTQSTKKEAVVEEVSVSDDEEIVAVISAAIAASMNTTVDKFVVRNIVRVNDDTPTWGKVARIDQVNSRLY